MMKINKREVLAIPNILSYIRIALLPVFCFLYLTAETTSQYQMAGIIVVISGLTDLVDGKIARKFNAVTELGKLMDPIADKLTLTVVAFCLVARFPMLIYLAVAILIKEVYMFVMTAKFFKRGKKLDGAEYFSKVCTTTLFAFFAGLIFFPDRLSVMINILVGFEIAMVTVTIAVYHRAFKRLI